MDAKQSLSSISENQDLWVAQYRQEIMERDYNSGMSAAENRGIVKGIAVGEERGRNEAKLEAARNMLTKKLLSFEDISEYTGLTLENVQQLETELKVKA